MHSNTKIDQIEADEQSMIDRINAISLTLRDVFAEAQEAWAEMGFEGQASHAYLTGYAGAQLALNLSRDDLATVNAALRAF